jgi:hypothetical protein
MQFAKRKGIAIVIVAIFVISGAGSLGASATATVPTQKSNADPTPAMGWSGWSFLRINASESQVEGEALAMVSSGLRSVGYTYINIDDGWYQCPGPQGPNVDAYGRWVVNAVNYPPVRSENGIQALASYVHSLGLKFGIYTTAGISMQAVTENTPVLGTSYTADEIVHYPLTEQANYNCGGMVMLNYNSPGAQAFVNSIVDEWASWGVDYIKLDGINDCGICNAAGTTNKPDVAAWSHAILQSGRPMVLDTTEGNFYVSMGPWLKEYSNQWEMASDIEINGPDEGSANSCYTPPFTGCLSVFPLTNYSSWGSGTYDSGSNVANRFLDVADWQPYGGPYGFNDYDSIEVGDGPANSGMSYAAEESQLSLWALGSAPLILGSDLTSRVTNTYGSSSGLNPIDFTLLTNRQVIEVDQDSIDASLISKVGTAQVFAKVEPSRDGIVGLFDTNTNLKAHNDIISTTTSAIGLPSDPLGYTVQNLWTGKIWTISSSGAISASVPSEGVALYRVTPITVSHSPLSSWWSIPTVLLEEWHGIAGRLSQFSL